MSFEKEKAERLKDHRTAIVSRGRLGNQVKEEDQGKKRRLHVRSPHRPNLRKDACGKGKNSGKRKSPPEILIGHCNAECEAQKMKKRPEKREATGAFLPVEKNICSGPRS